MIANIEENCLLPKKTAHPILAVHSLLLAFISANQRSPFLLKNGYQKNQPNTQSKRDSKAASTPMKALDLVRSFVPRGCLSGCRESGVLGEPNRSKKKREQLALGVDNWFE